jgi:hypothetical protein
MRIDRWNGGQLRRYHLPTGAIIAVTRQSDSRTVMVLPSWNHNVAFCVKPGTAAKFLKEARHAERHA